MATETKSIMTSISDVFFRMDKVHQNGIAVNQLESLAERGQVKDVFEEAQLFSGTKIVGNAECAIAPVPAPHILASVSREKYLEAATNAFTIKPNLLPKYDNVQFFSPQVVVWWKEKASQGPHDFINLYNLPSKEKNDFCVAISSKAEQAIDFVTKLKGRPTIWGTWGYGSQSEREVSGLTRGGPTVNEGHLHVTYYNYDEQSVILQQLSLKEKLIHYASWNEIVLEKFSSPIGKVISSILNTHLHDKVIADVHRENKIEEHANGSISIKNGFEINFDKEIPLKDVLVSLVEVTGKTEDIYQNIHGLFNTYHKYSDDKRQNAVAEMSNLFQNLHFSPDIAEEFSKFIFSIQPTYGQLVKWKDELVTENGNSIDLARIVKLIDKCQRVGERVRTRENKQNLTMAIIEDSLKIPTDNDIALTWSVHFSMCYIINDHVVKEDGIYVKSLHLYPEFVTTESAPERELGVVLKRPVIQI